MDDADDASSDDDETDLNPLESIPTRIPASSSPPGTRFTQVAAADKLEAMNVTAMRETLRSLIL
ncbi:hypothetical protein QBC37DRAFT_379419 [Rhypophila decipiens]|uniref:Uncharacterized protein n=1 Tax=Rhypophila decipiens TaxID=261697 RepID=A0AAN6XWY1_9PEZI|nr:hypothetical protein QBC37DRAFT_379419 [Rhypophila decipiens]